jgi:hypothetical protein
MSSHFPLVVTVAGVGRRGFVDGQALTHAYLDGPQEMVQLRDGSVLVADGRNNCVRVIELPTSGSGSGGGGVVTTLPTHAFLGPRSPVLIDNGAAVVLADSGHNKIRMVQIRTQSTAAPAASRTRGGGAPPPPHPFSVEDCTIAGTGRAGHHDGVADVATFNHPV